MSDSKIISVYFMRSQNEADDKLYEFEDDINNAIQKARENGVWHALIVAILQVNLTRETNDLIDAIDNVFDDGN